MDDVLGYILLENEGLPVDMSNLQIVDKPHLFYIRFDATLQSLDIVNRNRRKYKTSAILEGLEDPNLYELMKHKKWKGEIDHPITKNVQRIATVLSKFSCHYILKWWHDKNLVRGTIETIDDHRYGTSLARRILQGEDPSFSLRALASLIKTGTITCVNTPPRVVAYDEVNLCSHPEAYADGKYDKYKFDGKNETLLESSGAGLYDENDEEDLEEDYNALMDHYGVPESQLEYIHGNGAALEVTTKDIKHLVTRDCENLKIVCESFDLDPETFSFGNNANTLSVKNGTDTMIVNIGNNRRLCNEINDYYAYMTGRRK